MDCAFRDLLQASCWASVPELLGIVFLIHRENILKNASEGRIQTIFFSLFQNFDTVSCHSLAPFILKHRERIGGGYCRNVGTQLLAEGDHRRTKALRCEARQELP